MAFEPLSKSQKQLHFHLFWDELKMDYISVFFISFSSKSMLVASISCICNCKLFCSHLYDQVPWRIVVFKVTKMVDLDKNHKRMGWNGHDSL
jgi:hypothetical protein